MAPVKNQMKSPRPAARKSPRVHPDSKLKICNVGSSTNPLMIPEVTAHLLSFVDSESLAACRLTCTSWAELGSREIVRRVIFKFSDMDLDDTGSFDSIMKSVPKRSIRLNLSMTQFAFSRHFDQLSNLFSKYGERIAHLTLAFTEKEDRCIMLEFARLLWSTRYQIFMLKRILPNGPGDTEPISVKDLSFLSKLTCLDFNIEGGPPKQIMACQRYVEEHITKCVKNLILMTPNLTSMHHSWYHYEDNICCLAVEALVDVAPDHFRHLKVESSKLDWVALATRLGSPIKQLNLDTIWAETISRNFARIILSKEIGKSRVVCTGPRFRSPESQECVKKLRSTISSHEGLHSSTTKDSCGNNHVSVNCVNLFGDVAATLNEYGRFGA